MAGDLVLRVLDRVLAGAPAEERRFAMRAELDAAFFHLYGIERDDADYIMNSFRAFRNNAPERFGRTKDLILRIYDAMAEATRAGRPLPDDPRPAPGPRPPPSCPLIRPHTTPVSESR